MKLVVLFMSVFVGNVVSWGGYVLNFDHSDLEYDKSLMKIDFQTKKVGDKTVVNMKCDVLRDVNEPIIIRASQYEKVNDKYQHLVNSSVSVCNVLTRFKSNPIVKIVLNELLKSSNVPTGCPVKKAEYYMKDFSVNDDLLPPFIPTGSFMSRIEILRSVNGEEISAIKLTFFIDISRK